MWFNKGQGQRSIKTCNKVVKRKMQAFIQVLQAPCLKYPDFLIHLQLV